MNVTPACDFLSGIRLCLPSFEGMDGYSFRFSILFDSPSWLLIRSVQSRLNLETYAVVASTQIQHTSLSRSDSFQLLYKALDCRQSIANPLVPWQCEDTNCSYVISKYYLNEERCLWTFKQSDWFQYRFLVQRRIIRYHVLDLASEAPCGLILSFMRMAYPFQELSAANPVRHTLSPYVRISDCANLRDSQAPNNLLRD